MLVKCLGTSSWYGFPDFIRSSESGTQVTRFNKSVGFNKCNLNNCNASKEEENNSLIPKCNSLNICHQKN